MAEPRAYDKYINDRGELFQVLMPAFEEGTRRPMVVYQALFGEFETFVTSRDAFVLDFREPGGHKPLVRVSYEEEAGRMEEEEEHGIVLTQEEALRPHRYQEDTVEEGTAPSPSQDRMPSKEPEREAADPDASDPADTDHTAPDRAQEGSEGLDPGVEEFLDARTINEKIAILVALHSRITDDMIDTMAVASGVEVGPGQVEDRYQDLKECLLTIDRYEMNRSRLR